VNGLRLHTVNHKHLRISGIHPLLAACLQELPVILEWRDKPQAHDRLFPAPTATDEAANRDWHETVTPELRHLFASAGEIVSRDLTQLKPSPRQAGYKTLTIPLAHVPAWMNALNQARLILAALHGLDEIDMNLAYDTLDARKAPAVVRVDVFGILLEHFVRRELSGRARR
jgi:hypothetical protein